MLTTGLVSITFRKLTPPQIIFLVRKSGLKCIEWGGDVHVPHGNLKAARETYKHTHDAGLTVAAYGSYYHVGKSEKEQPAFAEVLQTAIELQAPTIRVWAGNKGSAETDGKTYSRIVRETQRIADLAAQAKITISFEYHGNTLTDTNDSALRLLDEVAHQNVASLWQPRTNGDVAASLDGLQRLLPRLSNVHVFFWQNKGKETQRCPLSAGKNQWSRYLEVLRSSPRDHSLLLEFVRDDDTQAFLEDARTLQGWVECLETEE